MAAQMSKTEAIREMLKVPIQLSQDVQKEAPLAETHRAECLELLGKAERLTSYLRQVAQLGERSAAAAAAAAPPLYTRPLARMVQELGKSLQKAVELIRRCNRKGVIRRMIAIGSSGDFKHVGALLDSSLADLAWFLGISRNEGEGGGMPPIASIEPLLGFCWTQIVLLCRGDEEEQEEAVSSLNDYARSNERFVSIMLEEEVIPPLLKVLQEGNPKARELAARTLGYIARYESVAKQTAQCGLAPALVKALSSSPMRVQAAVAAAMAELLAADREQQQVLFLELQAVRPLVALLGEFLDELPAAAAAAEKEKMPMSISSLMSSVAAAKNKKDSSSDPPPPAASLEMLDDGVPPHHHAHKPSAGYPRPSSRPGQHLTSNGLLPFDIAAAGASSSSSIASAASSSSLASAGKLLHQQGENSKALTQRELNRRAREAEDPRLKAEVKAEAARALAGLARACPAACMSITETKALLCLAALMEKEGGALQLNAALAVMEIMAVAECSPELKSKGIRINSPAMKAVVDQLLRLVGESRSPELQVLAIRAVGCLARTFTARDTRVIGPLVKQLESPSEEVVAEAIKALKKFACGKNYLNKEHSKAIVSAGAADPLTQTIFMGKGEVVSDAAILMCYLVLFSDEAAALSKVDPLAGLKRFSKYSHLLQEPDLELLNRAISHLDIYPGRQPGDLSDPFS